MQIFVKLISMAGLGLTLIPAFLVFGGSIDLAAHKNLMILGAVLWFASAPFAFGREETTEAGAE
jgi:high-affinity Fe2+/Pb2+ permease